MKRLVLLSIVPLLLVACRDNSSEVEISETRPLCVADESPTLNATSRDRFLPPGAPAQMPELGTQSPGKWAYEMPATWRDAGPRTMREVNLAFGTEGEAYVSVSRGSLQENVDRWYGQFGAESKPVETLERHQMLGGDAILVEATGRYEPGMGRPGKDHQSLLGAMVLIDGNIVTVKMTGPTAEVTAEKANFLNFISSLKQDE